MYFFEDQSFAQQICEKAIAEHWPEVMVSYDLTTRTLFSADAFGTFGAINGALFADEVDFFRDYVDEARRYYCNIVGKYPDSHF